jgi:hypothetical protein
MSEKKKKELRVGDVITAKQGGQKYLITQIAAGMAGPYLVLRDEDGNKAEHDTSWDSLSATYTVDEHRDPLSCR